MAEDAPEKKQDTLSQEERRTILRRVAAMFSPYSGKVWLTVITVLIGVVLGLLPPLWLQIIIDEGITKSDLGVVTTYSLLTVVITLIAASLTLAYGWLAVLIGQNIMRDLRGKLFRHLQRMPLSFFTSTRTGDIQTRMISDVEGVQTVLSTSLVDAISNIAIVISCLVAMIIIDWRLTLLSVAMVPVFAFIGKHVGEFARKVTKGAQEQTSTLNSMMQETLSVSGILLAKTTGRTDLLNEKFDVENQELVGWKVKVQLLQYFFFGMIRLITTLAPALVYWFAAWLLVARNDPSITVGLLVTFTMLQTRLFFPITGLLSLQVQIWGSFALFQRLFEYLDIDPAIKDRAGAKPLVLAEDGGAVSMKGVNFRYPEETEDWTLADISFDAAPGTLTALVGPSGAGKTTLTYLIPRLYDADEGSVTLDGQDVKDVTLGSLGTQVGMVTQETYLLHASVRENLLLARPEATQEELEEACRAAAIHDHIAQLADGYDTTVGERGYKVSGGEKQRLAIARAILKNPRILILDEATSALDTRSERLIQSSLNELMKGRTTFAIAHRLSTILEADQILVLQEGRIVEKGKHEELLANSGLYAKLYREQFRSEEDAPV